MRRLKIVALVALSVVGVLGSVGSASASPGDPWVLQASFGENLNLEFGNIVVNQETGNILVSAGNNTYQFDSSGNPVNFPATGSPFVSAGGQLAIDNTGGPSQGSFYIQASEEFHSYRADGSPIGTGIYGPGAYWPSIESMGFGATPCGITALPNGNLLYNRGATAQEMTAEAQPTGNEVAIGEGHYEMIGEGSCSLGLDGKGNAYTFVRKSPGVGVARFDVTHGFADLGETGLACESLCATNRLIHTATDPVTGDVFMGEGPFRHLFAVPYSDPPAKLSPYEPVRGLTRASGFAFGPNETLYIANWRQIDVFRRETLSAPRDLGAPSFKEVRSRGTLMRFGMFDDNTPATYRIEYGPTSAYGQTTQAFDAPLSSFKLDLLGGLSGLTPDTTYHVRIAATNAAGTTYGPDAVFKTYPVAAGADFCPNALARKQTTAQRLPDCRAYELASAADTGGYDVESYLAPGQSPFPGFPLATDKLLYATHSGAVPGPWNATNKGPDPYVATRTANGWVTQYEGLPSDLSPAAGSFSSALGEADQSLSTLAFAGPGLCDPCFGSGLATGVPVRLPSGELVQGMAGSLSGSVPASAKPEGKVAKYFSGDGRKLLFASKYAFEPGANASNGSLTVYERDLAGATTEIVSTDPAGNALTGEGISELDVSGDGSRVVIGKKVSTDSQGNEYVHPYLHLAGRPGSIDLAPGTTSGVLYAGMTSDGSKVFFTTPDKLAGSDTDTSADLYEAAVDGSGNLTLAPLTTANSDACSPVANEAGTHWNTTGANVDCSAVAIAGGVGVASNTGAVYFLSPESLGGQGTLNQPNLYLATPGGAPQLVATLGPNDPLVLDSVKANATRRTADFQTTPSGNYAAFGSGLDLTALPAHGFRSVYRYEAGSSQLECVSCDRTGTTEASIFGPAELPPNGLALLEDGRLFFTTAAQLALNDANGKLDVYEWTGGGPQLISAGSGSFDSALLTASADGTDVFFFTHDDLASEEDRNRALMRIYDAREGGGFFKLPVSVPCQASDECHGPGTPQPAPADIKSSGKTTQGNVVVCPKNRVKKRGQCVKRAHAKKHRKKHAEKRKGAAKKRAAKTNGKRGGRDA